MFRIFVLFSCMLPLNYLKAQAPGGFSSGLSFWLKADGSVFQDINGTNPANLGSNVLSWRDQAGNALLQNSLGETPAVLRNSTGTAINFNPVVDFQNGHMFTPNTPGLWTLFIVAEPYANNPLAPLLSMPCTPNTCASRQVRVETTTNWYCCDGDDFSGNTQTLGFGTNGITGFSTAHLFTLTAGDLYVYFNGLQIGDTVTYAAPNVNRRFWGRVAEVVAYNDILSASDRERVQTYLALKYGLALDQNYVSSSGAVLWNTAANSGYNSRITGIGRDDASGLLQKQSTSTIDDNLTLALGAIAATNQGNGANPTNNKFLLWGHNDLALNDKVLLPSAIGAINYRSAKVYKFANTGNLTDNIQLRFEYSLLDCANPAQARLLISDDENFSNPTVVNLQSFTANSLTFSTSAIANGKYVAIGYALTPPVAPTVSGNLQICESGTNNTKSSVNTTTLTASGALNGATDWYWYGTDCGAGLLGTGATINITQAGTYFVRGENPACGIAGPCTQVVVTGYVPDVSISSNSPVCAGGTLTLFGNSSYPIESWAWSNPAGWSSTVQNPVVNNVPDAFNGSVVLTVTDTAGCFASTDANLEILSATNAEAGPDQFLCNVSSTQMAANDVSGTWSLISGSATIVSPAEPNTQIINLTPGATVVLQWTTANGPCTDTDQVSIFNDLDVPANAGPDQDICHATTSALQATPATPGTGVWTKISGPGTVVSPSSPSSQVNGLIPGQSSVFRWTVTGPLGVCSNFDETTINSNLAPPAANAGANQLLCDVYNTVITGNTPQNGNGLWTVISGSATIVPASGPGAEVSGLQLGTTVLQWTITPANGCPATQDQMSIVVRDPNASITSSDPVCAGGALSLLADGNALVSYQWAGPNGFSSTQSTVTIDPVSAANAGDYFLTVTDAGGCTAVVTENVEVISLPIANAGPDQQLCEQTSTSVSANDVLGVWSVVSGTANIVNPTEPNTDITGLVPGSTVVLRWTASNNGFCFAFDELSIQNDLNANPADAGPDQQLCNAVNTQLQGNSPAGGSGLWTKISGPGNVVNPASPTSLLNGLIPGQSTLLRWRITGPGGICISEDTVRIFSNPVPPAANAGPDQLVCNQSTTVVNGNVPQSGSGLWTVVSGSATILPANGPNAEVLDLQPGITILRWSITPDNGCPATQDELTITVSVPDPFIVSSAPICAGQELNMIVDGNELVQYQWSGPNGFSAIQDQIIINPAGTVNAGNYTVTVTDLRGCTDIETILVEIDPLPVADAGPDQDLCEQSSTQMAANDVSGEWVLVSGVATIASPFEPNTAITGLLPGSTVRLRWVATATGATLCTAQDEVLIVNNVSPGTADAGPDQQICGNTTQMAATAPGSSSGAWTLVSGSATFANANDPATLVSGLAAGANVLRWTLLGGASCPGSSDEVTIVVNQALSADAGPDQSVCYQNNATLAAITPFPGTSGQWTVVSGNAVFSNNFDPQSGITGLADGVNVLRWTISAANGICPPVADEVQITAVPAPGLANAGDDIQICGVSVQMQATAPANGSGIWSIVSGNAVINTPANPNSPVSGLENGTPLFLSWTVANSTCPAFSDTVQVFAVHPLPMPSAGPDQSICYEAVTQLAAEAAPGNTNFFWSVVSGSGQVANENDPNTAVENLSNGLNIFQWNWSDAFGVCPNVSDQVFITRIASPGVADAGPDASICLGEKAPLQALPVQNGAGVWTSTNGNVVVETPDAPNSLALLNGSDTLIWSISNGGCPALTDTVVLTPAGAAPAAEAGADRSFCGAQEIAMQAILPAGFSGLWTAVNGNGTFTDITAPNSYLENLAVGNNTFRWTIQSPAGSCQTSSDEVTLTLLELPSLADAGPDQAFCGDKTILQANTPATGQGQWTILSGNGVLDNSSDPNALLSGVSAGATLTLSWTISNGACPVTYSDEVFIQVVDPASIPTADAGADQNLCYTNAAVLQATAPASGTGAWSFVSGSGVFDDLSNASSGISGLTPGLNELQWTVDPGLGCPISTDMVTILVTPAPEQPLAGADQTLCAANQTQLGGNTLTIGQGAWEILSGPGTLNAPNTPNSILSGLVPGQNTVLQWTSSNGACPVWATDEVLIGNDLIPSTAQAGPDISGCLPSAVLNAAPPAVGTGTWSVQSGGGLLSDPGAPNSNFTNIPVGVSTLIWNVSNGVCPPSSDAVQISNIGELSANAGPDQNVCNLTQLPLNATAPANGNGVWSIASGNGQIIDPLLPQSILANLTPGSTITLQWTVALPGCNSASDAVTIQNDAPPSSALAGDDQVLCGDNSFVLQAIAPGSGSGQWSFLNGNGLISNPGDPGATVSNLIFDVPVTLLWTISNGVCPPARDTLEIFPKTLPSAALAGADQALCNATQATLSALAPTVGAGVWEILSGNGQIIDNQLAATAVNNLTPGSDTLVLRWSVTVPGCHENADTLQIINDALPSQAQAGVDPVICFDEVQLNAIPPATGAGVWSIGSGSAVIQDPASAQSIVSNIPQGSSATLVWTVSNGVCPASSDAVTVSYYNDDILYADFLVNAVACVGDSFHIVEISDSSLLADSYFWEFGDGVTSTERDPVHTYSSAGDFVVRLTATLGPCSTTMEKTVLVANCFQTGFQGNSAFAYGKVQPNPNAGHFRLFLQMNRPDQPVETLLFNTTGELLEKRDFTAQATMWLDYTRTIPGVYYLKVLSGRDQMVFKIVTSE